MSRLSAAPYRTSNPATYAEIVAATNKTHARRVAELKAASKVIIATEPDLAALNEQGIHYATGNQSMYLVDWHPADSATPKKALYIGSSLYPKEYIDRLVSAFLARGWLVDHVKVDGVISKVLLLRSKTRIRVILDCSEALAKQLCPEPTTEAA